MKRLSFSLVPLGVAAALAIALAPGCTTHGEGGRCDPDNKNATGGFADCDDNLTCTPGSELSLPEGGTVTGDICCPQDRSTATTQICHGSPISPGSDAGIPDGGFESSTNDATTDQSTSDVSTDVVTDSPSDVSTDAVSDAPSDATGD